ncbi:MAG: hypothetical protein UHX00_14445 [Caryophanon sp.]|nr:hypothetical protein [Caryophanon sp.]
MKKKNLFLTSTFAAALLLAACTPGEKDQEEKAVEEQPAIEETIEPTEPVVEEGTTEEGTTEETDEVAEPTEPAVTDPAQTPSTSDSVAPSTTEGIFTNDVAPSTTQSAGVSTGYTAPAVTTGAIDVSTKKANEVIIYTSDANAENVIPTAKIAYEFKTDGPITKYLIDQLGYEEYYNKHAVSADETVIMIDFKESIVNSSFVQGTAGGQMFKDSIVATIFENIPQAQVIKLRVNGQEQDTDHVSFSGEITRGQFN